MSDLSVSQLVYKALYLNDTTDIHLHARWYHMLWFIFPGVGRWLFSSAVQHAAESAKERNRANTASTR